MPHGVADQNRKKAQSRRAEYTQMQEAYCAEHKEDLLCMQLRLKQHTDHTKEEVAAMHEKLSQMSLEERKTAKDAMLEFWCNDPAVDRDEQGVCLMWKLRRDKHLVEEKQKPIDVPWAKADVREQGPPGLDTAYKAENDAMHEWYCTKNSAEVEDSQPCLQWRITLKDTSVEERKRLTQLNLAMNKARLEGSKAFSEKLKLARELKDHEALDRAQAEWKEYREHGRAAFTEMMRAWCEDGEGKGKSDEDSPICKRYRDGKVKAEL